MGWLRVRLVWATRHVLIRILTVFAVIRLWLFVRFFGECDLAAYPPPPPSRRRRRRAAGKEKATQQQQQQQQPGCIPSCLGDEGMDVVGHRGASARAPENTLASFRLALADGFRGVELDVHMSRDGRVFVLHDSTLRRVCDPSYRAKLSSSGGGGGGGGNVLDTPVRLLDWGVISRVPVGLHRGQPCYPPLLSDVLTLLAQEPCPPPQSDDLTNCFQPRVVLIEFKECDNEICERVAGIVRRFLRQQCAEKPSSSSVLASDRAKLRFKKKREEEEEQEGPATSRTLLDIRFISFRLACLSRMKALLPRRRCYLLLAAPPCPCCLSGFVERMLCRAVERSVAAGLDGIDVNADPAVVTPQFVQYCHSRGQDVLVWVSPSSIETCAVYSHMANLGVSLFTSDLPPPMLEWKAAVDALANDVSDKVDI